VKHYLRKGLLLQTTPLHKKKKQTNFQEIKVDASTGFFFGFRTNGCVAFPS